MRIYSNVWKEINKRKNNAYSVTSRPEMVVTSLIKYYKYYYKLTNLVLPQCEPYHTVLYFFLTRIRYGLLKNWSRMDMVPSGITRALAGHQIVNKPSKFYNGLPRRQHSTPGYARNVRTLYAMYRMLFCRSKQFRTTTAKSARSLSCISTLLCENCILSIK